MDKTRLKSAIPLIFGLIGIAAYIGYFFIKDSSNNFALNLCTVLPPIAFFCGTVSAFLTRKNRKNNTLWWSGLAVCSIGAILYVLLIVILICAAIALRDV